MVMLNRYLLTSLHAFEANWNIKNYRHEAYAELNIKVKFDQYGYAYLTLANIASINWTEGKHGHTAVMYNIPVFCVVQNSCFLCCTKFLFSMMYNIPVWDVVP